MKLKYPQKNPQKQGRILEGKFWQARIYIPVKLSINCNVVKAKRLLVDCNLVVVKRWLADYNLVKFRDCLLS